MVTVVEKRSRIVVHCRWCGEEITRPASRVFANSFCNRECHSNFRLVHNGKKVRRTCANCGALLAVSVKVVLRFPNSYCCKKCRLEWWRGRGVSKGG